MKKCRVYDKHLKIIRHVKYIDFANEEVMYYADEFESNEDKANLDIVKGFDEVNIMWSTGLKDKHGVEIFEGDIIDVGTRIPFLNKIQKDEETGYFKLVPIDKRWAESYFTSFEDKSRYEILGNIYENPELLEVEDEKM